jgi:phage head maturation protease
MLNAVSVGFIPKEASPLEEGGMEITEWELLEFSAVSVPANQDALAQAVKSFGINENDLVDPIERIKSLEEKIEGIEDDTVLIVDDEIEIDKN